MRRIMELSIHERFGKGAYITKATSQLMRDLGSIQAPQNAFLLNIGLETLHLRVPRHCENALKAAEYLKNHEKVAWVCCPSMPGDKYYDLASEVYAERNLWCNHIRLKRRKRCGCTHDGQPEDDRDRDTCSGCEKLCAASGKPHT